MKRLATWFVILCLGGLAGAVAGYGIDTLVWHVSNNYIYNPGQFADGGWRLGLFWGSLAAAAAAVGSRPAASWRAVVVGLLLACGCVAAGGLLGALAGGIWGKLQSSGAPDSFLAPIARVWFCQGLWQGTAAGSVVGTACGSWSIWRRRAGSGRN